MTFALLVIPGAAALRLTTDVVRASLLAALLGATAHVLGLGLSFVPAIDLPSAPLAVVVLAGLFACTVPIRRA